MTRKKTKGAPRPRFQACGKNGCERGMIRVIRDGVSMVRPCSCNTERAPQQPSLLDGKARAANG
jgi:hypothetical protein